MGAASRFFVTLDPVDVEAISRVMRYQPAHPNAVLMQTGDVADKFYLVLRGSLQVLVNGQVTTTTNRIILTACVSTHLVVVVVVVHGQVVATKGAGDTFGEMALLSFGEKRSADVIAMQLCDLATLHRTDYHEIAQEKQNAKIIGKLGPSGDQLEGDVEIGFL